MKKTSCIINMHSRVGKKLVYIKTPGCRNTVSEIFGGMRNYAQGCAYIRIFTLLIAPNR